MRPLLLLLGLGLITALPAAAARECHLTEVPGLAACFASGSTYQEESVVYDDPAVALVGVRHVHFEGFAGPDTTYQAFAFTGAEGPAGANGAEVHYRCLQFNGGPQCNLLDVGASASLAGLGGPSQGLGYHRDFAQGGAWCLEGLVQRCQPGPFPLPPLPSL